MLIILTVHRHGQFPDPRQRGCRDAASSKVCAGSTLGTDGATHQHGVVLITMSARVDEDLVDLRTRRMEASLDHGSVVAVTHHRRVRAPAEEEPQPTDDHGLARSGLTRDDRESRPELDLGLVDDAKPPQGERRPSPGHRRPRHPSTGRENLATNRSVNGLSPRRARCTGRSWRRMSTRPPAGISKVRRPSAHSTA